MALLVSFEGHSPTVHPSAWVAPTATLIGDVTVEADASVWYGCVLRADTERIVVGRGSNLQDNSVVHADAGVPTLIGTGVGIGHSSVIHGATIEDACLIGMSVTLLNRSRIGGGALVAAGALVLEGQEIPGAMLAAGVPAKVRRQLDAGDRELVRLNAVEYQALARKYREGGL
jgi:carbonic anhydrase/acetyltransferase-like protein (isoleucine patch superfamily)